MIDNKTRHDLGRYVDVTVTDSYYGLGGFSAHQFGQKRNDTLNDIIERCQSVVKNKGFIVGWDWGGDTEFAHSQEYCTTCKYRFRCYTLRGNVNVGTKRWLRK